MKTIIAGSRTITDYAAVCKAVADSGFAVTEVVSGHASKRKVGEEWLPSVDLLGERWSREFLHKAPTLFRPNWLIGKQAGYVRNVEMAEYAEALIAVWDGESRGTKHMIDIARAKGLAIFVSVVEQARSKTL